MSSKECPLCIEPFSDNTNSQKYGIACFSCNYKACRSCIRRYVLNSLTEEIACMNCNTEWKDERIKKELLPTFFKTQFKELVKNIRYQQQLAMLTLSQPKAEATVNIEKCDQKISESANDRSKLLENYQKTKDKYYEDYNEHRREENRRHRKKMEELENNYNAQVTELSNKKRKEPLIVKYNEIQAERRTHYEILHGDKKSTKTDEYTRPCMVEGCKGLLKKNWICNLCDTMTCKKCFDPVPKDKVDSHVCDPNKVATAELIKKDTKNCPKCGTGIHRIEGCSQMFCTSCYTAFDWKTLNIITKNFHNPHYDEYLRRNPDSRLRNANRQGAMQLDANGCVANPEFTDEFRYMFLDIERFCRKFEANNYYYKQYEQYAKTGTNIVSFMLHLNHLLDNYDHTTSECDKRNDESRVLYILNRITEDDFKKAIHRNCSQNKFTNERRQIVITIKEIITDMLFNYINNDIRTLSLTIEGFGPRAYTKRVEHIQRNIADSKFIDMKNKLIESKDQIVQFVQYCIEQDTQLKKIYDRTSKFDITRGLEI